MAHYEAGAEEKAAKVLARALTLAEPEGYLRIFLDEGPRLARAMLSLLPRLPGRTTESGGLAEYAGRILAAFPLAEQQPGSGSGTGASDRLIEPLSKRELDVLRLMAEGGSNKEIADRLFVSIPTVKWHTGNIFGKLAVANRMQAVARARAIGLLPRS